MTTESQPPTQPALMSIRKTAAYLDLSEREVYRMMARGELERVAFGRTVRITTRSAERAIERRLSEGGGDATQG